MLVILSPDINNKLMPIFFFFCLPMPTCRNVKEARINVYGWRKALKVSELGPEHKDRWNFSR